MKKVKYFLVFIVIFIIIIFSLNYIYKLKKIASTNLSNVFIDGIKTGDNIEEIDLTKYKVDNSLKSEENTLHYEQLSITFNNKIITKITGRVYQNDILTINNVKCKNTQDIINILGNEYSSGWYNIEQRLKNLIFYDYNNKLKVTFVYESTTNNLVWVIIENYNY